MKRDSIATNEHNFWSQQHDEWESDILRWKKDIRLLNNSLTGLQDKVIAFLKGLDQQLEQIKSHECAIKSHQEESDVVWDIRYLEEQSHKSHCDTTAKHEEQNLIHKELKREHADLMHLQRMISHQVNAKK